MSKPNSYRVDRVDVCSPSYRDPIYRTIRQNKCTPFVKYQHVNRSMTTLLFDRPSRTVSIAKKD